MLTNFSKTSMLLNNNFDILSEKAVNSLAQNYKTLDYRNKLLEKIQAIYPYESLEFLPKYELHKLINRILFNNHNGEEVLKYKLFEYHLNKPNVIGAFEIKVNTSRVDFLTINGHTTSYEIKSALDNLCKLDKQMSDYILAFEYNYLVIDEKHIEKVREFLPACFGLWSYNLGKYKKLIKAKLSDKINGEVQLKLLTKKELIVNFPNYHGLITDILKNESSEYINSQFKKILKKRYKSRWDFLISNNASIFPIDIPFFFNTNISPELIYNQ